MYDSITEIIVISKKRNGEKWTVSFVPIEYQKGKRLIACYWHKMKLPFFSTSDDLRIKKGWKEK